MEANKRKKQVILLSVIVVLLIAAVVAIFFITSAYRNPYRISKTSVQLDLFDTQKLTVKDSDGNEVNAHWASDNSCVEVDQRGNLTGKSVGTAKVTATIGKAVLTCKVTVSIPKGKGVVLKLNREEVELMLGNSITIKATLLYDGVEMEMPKLSVSTDKKKVSAKVLGDSIILTGEAVTEELKVTVGCSWNGYDVANEIAVSVTDDVIVRLSSSWLDLYTFQYKDYNVEDTLSVLQVFIEDVEQTTWDISWKVLDEKIISFKDGKVSALSEGETDIVAILEHDGKAYEAYCHVVVTKTKIDLTALGKQEIVLDRASRGGTLNIAAYSILHNFKGTLCVDDLSGNEHKIAASLKGKTLTIGKGLLGAEQKNIAIKSEKFDVIVSVAIVNMEITTAQDLINLTKYVDRNYSAASFSGYFRLLNNIEFGDVKVQAKGVWDDYFKGFTGVFDGCGYTINGGLYGPGGLFGVVGEGGEIKNLAIISAGIGVDSYSEFAKNGDWYPGILAGELHGKVTDVLIEVCYRTLGWYSGSNGAWGQVMGRSLSNAELTRVVVTHGELPAGKLKTYIDLFAYEGGENDKKVKLVDVYFENDMQDAASATNFFGVADTYEGEIIGIPTDENLNWMITKENFGNIWYLEGKTPQFVSHCTAITDINKDYGLYNAISSGKRLANTKGLTIDLKSKGYTNKAFVRINGVLQSEISINNGVLTIGNETLKKLGIGTHSLQISKTKEGQSIFANVNIYTALLSTAEDVQNLLAYADQTKVWTTGNTPGKSNTYTGVSYTGSFALTKNIQLGDTRLSNILTGYTDHCGFNGTFDGRGYTLIGGQYYLGGMFGNVGVNAVIKNFAIVDGKLACASYGAGGAWSTYEMAPTVLGRNLYGTMSDVLIDITGSINGEPDKGNGYGTCCGSVFIDVYGGTVKNTIVYMPLNTVTVSNGFKAFANTVQGGNWPGIYLYDAAGNVARTGYQSIAENLITFATDVENNGQTMPTAGNIVTTMYWAPLEQHTFSFKLGTTLAEVRDTTAKGYDDLNDSANVNLSTFNSKIWDMTGDIARLNSYKTQPAMHYTISESDIQLALGEKATLKVNNQYGRTVSATWKASNDKVKVVDGLVTGMKPGAVVVTATVGNTKLTCQVSVTLPADAAKVSDYELYTSVNNGVRIKNTQSITYDFSQYDFTNKIVVKSGETDISNYATIRDGKVTIGADKLQQLGSGTHELLFSNGQDISVPVTIHIYTALLSTAEDVQNLLAYADQTKVWTSGNESNNSESYTGVSYTGSFALTQNIRLGDTRLSNILTGYTDHCGFNGTFDGRGYTLIGGQYYLGGMFGNVGVNAVIKNFAIVDGTLVRASYGAGGAWSTYEMAPTVLGRNLYGTMSDVLIDITGSINGEPDKGNGYGTCCGSVFIDVYGGTVKNTIVYMPLNTVTVSNGFKAFANTVQGGNWPGIYLYDAAGNVVRTGYQSIAENLITFATDVENNGQTMPTAGNIVTTMYWATIEQHTFSFKLDTTLEQVRNTAAEGYDDLNANENVDLSVFNSKIWDLSGEVARFVSYK